MATLHLVTGATGFLGGHIVRQLLAQGHPVRALALPDDPTMSALPDGVEIFAGDVLNMDSLLRFFQKDPEDHLIVIHCAGIITMRWEVDERAYAVNVVGTRNIVKLCLQNDARLVYVSSVHAIPELPHGQMMAEPDTFDPALVVGGYAKTKAEATQAVLDAARMHGLSACTVHPSGLCGPGDTQCGYLTQMFIDYAHGNIPAGVDGGYGFADVRDVAAAILACVEKGRKGASYILDGDFMTVRQIFGVLNHDLHMRRTRLYVPLWVARSFLPLFTLWYRLRGQKPVFNRYSLYTLGINGAFSSRRAREELGFAPRPYRDSIVDAVNWLVSNGRIPAPIDKALHL